MRSTSPEAPPAFPVRFLDLGRTDFDSADRAQKSALEERLAGGPDTLVLAELEPVVTLGRGTRSGDVLALRHPVRFVERGGRATLHLPGQLVAYPVFGLGPVGRDIAAWIRCLEGFVIATLADFGVEGTPGADQAGIWARLPGDGPPVLGKIASIGVAVRRFTSYHGLSINVSPRLEEFETIHPCGLDARLMTSMARLRGEAPSLERVKESFRGHVLSMWAVELLS